jgi:hypothetical protein
MYKGTIDEEDCKQLSARQEEIFEKCIASNCKVEAEGDIYLHIFIQIFIYIWLHKHVFLCKYKKMIKNVSY